MVKFIYNHVYIITLKMTTTKKEYKNMKLQHHSGRYTITIPEWMVKKVLDAKKGDTINFDFKGDKIILQKGVKNE